MPQYSLPDERERHISGIEDAAPLDIPEDALDALGEVIENADGSATIALPEEEQAERSFDENLAERLDSHERRRIATQLLELIERDASARSERDKQYAEGLQRTGLGNDAPGGADFPGASRTVHPMLAEACVDFSARAMKELCPANGPVKTKTLGPADSQKLERAKRKRDYLNHLYTRQIEEYYPEKEQLLTQLPMGGSQYEKYWFDTAQGRICMEFVPVDDVLLPYACSSFYTAPRVTHKQKVIRADFEDRVAAGFYRDLERALPEGPEPEKSAAESATDKIEGRTETGYNEDGLRVVYEVTCALDIEDDPLRPEGRRGEYVVHIDLDTQEMLAAYRNWRQDDPLARRLHWWVEDIFIPWRGAYGLGLPQLIGSLSGAVTGAIRAVLDAAHIQNIPTAAKLKSGRGSGSNISLVAAGLTEIDSAGSDDIRKVLMAMPFNGPSPVLVQMIELLTAHAKGVVATAEEKIADASNQMPVGTAMALIEQGSQVFSAIHARLHNAQARGMQIVCRLVRESAPEEELRQWGLTRQDFSDESDIEPVSDPRIFSEAQRYAQLQEEFKVIGMTPNLNWNTKSLARRALELLRVDHVDEVLPKDPEPITSDPVQENQAALLGAPLRAAPQQDHMAHIRAHLSLVADPFVMTMYDPQVLSGFLQHCKEHFAMFYGTMAQAAAQQALRVVVNDGKPVSPDQMASLASQQALLSAQQELGTMAQGLAQIHQQIKAKLPPEPMDAATATFNAAMAEVERKKQLDKSNQELKGKELELKPLLEQLSGKFDTELAMIRERSAQQQEELRQTVALLKNKQDNEQHQMTELLKNLQDNMTQLRTAQQAAAPAAPDFAPQIEQLNRALFDVERSRSNDALAAVMEGLRATIGSMNRPRVAEEDPETGRIIMRTIDEGEA